MQTLLKRAKKYIFKHPAIMLILAWLIHLYLRLTYLTIRWQVHYTADDIKENTPALLALWHQKLAFGVGIFGKYCRNSEGYPLVSPHKDGKIIADILRFFGFKIIAGSSNKQANLALKAIIRQLASNKRIVITPDGPRGPAKKINGAICEIAKKYQTPIMAASCHASSCFQLKSWDQMQIPKPFSKVIIIYGTPFIPGASREENELKLANILNQLELEALNKSK